MVGITFAKLKFSSEMKSSGGKVILSGPDFFAFNPSLRKSIQGESRSPTWANNALMRFTSKM